MSMLCDKKLEREDLQVNNAKPWLLLRVPVPLYEEHILAWEQWEQYCSATTEQCNIENMKNVQNNRSHCFHI